VGFAPAGAVLSATGPHLGKPSAEASGSPPAALSNEEFNKRLNEMIKLPSWKRMAAPVTGETKFSPNEIDLRHVKIKLF
jgi:hypothetical protein